MLRIMLLAVPLLVVSTSTFATEGESDKDPIIAVDLTDGSHLVGKPQSSSFQIHTSFAELGLPLKLVRRIEF